MDNKTPFLPARGKEENILKSTPTNGMVWFATDTRKIYYSNGESFISMGGNSGIYYGQMRPAETPEEGQKDFDFLPEDIEGNENNDTQTIPNENDLIFNSPDNSFYRVIEVEKDEIGSTIIHTRLLTVAGGGGGGGSGETTTGKMTLSRLGDSEVTVLEGAPCLLGLRFTAVDASGEQTGKGSASIWVGGTKRSSKNIEINQGDNWIDISQYLDADTQIVQIYVEGSIGGVSSVTQSKRWTVNKVRLNVTWNYNDSTIQSGESVLLTYSVSTSILHQVHIVVDDIYTALPPQNSSTLTQSYNLSKSYGLTHGAHKVSMYVTTNINGIEITSKTVNHTILYQEADNSSPIIAFLNYNKNVTQYDTLLIPIIVFDPTNSSGEINLILREDGIDRDTWTIGNGSRNTWSYTPTTAGVHRLLVVCNNTEAYQDIDVTKLVLNNEEVPGYEFKFKASDFISNNTVQNWNSNGITATFSDNFDWHNGGLHIEETDNGTRQYFCVKAGTTMTINARPFKNLSANKGKTIKFIYKATNCRNYDAQVLSCYEQRSNIDSRGILINAQNAIISCESVSLNIPFCEDSYIELEMDVWDGQVNASGTKQNYLMSWIDGVPAGCKVYTDGTSFDHNQVITIGSNDCDVYIYLLKSYDRHLTDDQHLANFIADAYNAQEMIDRYRRNDILGDNGDISYTKLALAAPKVKIHLYDIPRMTAAKKDEVKGCTYQQFYGSAEAEVSATNVSIQGQGTSSSRYGISAFNLDSKFYDGFDYADGTHSSKYSMTPTSIPVNYFNTKVNVASCECANNALNQEWYNKWQPFICEYRAKNGTRTDGKLARDTMEFPYPGVIFVKDNNPITTNGADSAVDNNCFIDTDGYVNNPYYKMYALCNMGNSKKNTAVFHDADNPYECCVENLDNQRPEQWMTGFSELAIQNNIQDDLEAAVYIDEKGKAQSAYEFRFIADESKKQELSNAWYNLVSWFMHNDPSPYNADSHPFGYTNELLPNGPETYVPYTFKGYKSAKSNYTPERQILKGTTISNYAGTYTHDTYERRIAKLLSECENYLIMDALVYHYLFIERHTMIDNVAKNTFWSTEDGQHWAPIKDYDNDTSDGNDNQGELTLTYGYEVLDKVKGKDINVFNAQHSVWLHFVQGLYMARQTVYLALDNLQNGESAWDANSYLKMFEEYQNAIPERCWIADYHKKYLRPYEVYGESSYIAMLEGGKKTHQRKQFEIYQQEYMASEYFGRNAHSSAIEFRGNAIPDYDTLDEISNPANKDLARIKTTNKIYRYDGNNWILLDDSISNLIREKSIIITMYSDCYINAAFGSGDVPNVSIRAQRNQPVEITPPTENMGNATIYFYSAGNITSLDKLYSLFAGTARIGAATRLREFSLGSELFNNNNITQIEFGANKMLENLQLQNLPNLKVGLDLSNLTSLQQLNTTGSGFTTLTIGSNAPVKSLQLNALGRISLSNLYTLETFTMDNYNNLGAIYIDNIDNNIINSKNILMNALKARDDQGRNVFSDYMLKNVQWIINDPEELDNTSPAIITILNGLLETQINSSTGLLENKRNPKKIVNGSVESSTREEAVTGNLTITDTAYSGDNALDIYNYYAFSVNSIDNQLLFPSLDINFTGSQQLFTVNIYNGQNQICWSKKLTADANIDETFLSSGPNGSFLDMTMSDYQDTASVYTFENAWNLQIGNNESILLSTKYPYYEHNDNFTDNISIYPKYTSSPREYTATFFVNGESYSQKAAYDSFISQVTKLRFPNGLYKSDTDLPFNLTYEFKGWSLLQDSTNVIPDTVQLKGDSTYYAVFEEVDVHEKVDVTLFNYTPYSYGDITGVEISPKQPLALAGKVTIPTEDQEGNKVISMNNFSTCNNLTHIFFKSDSNLKIIESNCFRTDLDGDGENIGLPNLIYIEPNNSLQEIGSNAFHGCHLRIDLQDEDYILGGNNLKKLGRQAFKYALYSESPNRTVIVPPSVTRIDGGAVAMCHNGLRDCTIQIGTPTVHSNWDYHTSIGSEYEYRFYQNAGYNVSVDYYSNINYPNGWNTNLENGSSLINLIADYPNNFKSIMLYCPDETYNDSWNN